jgi:hypothetical protein
MRDCSTKSDNMLSRRGLLKLGVGACTCALTGMTAPRAHARVGKYYCAMYNRGSTGGFRDISDLKPLSSVDPTIAGFLSSDQSKLEKLFGLKGQLLGSATEDGAFSSLEDGADPARDGKVVLGKRFIDGIKDEKYGLLRLSAILAHEYSHLYQYKSGDFDRLSDGCGQNDRPALLTELHADYLAGVYMGWRGEIVPDAQTALSLYFYTLGDAVFLRDHHGLPPDRSVAFHAGFDQGTKAVRDGKVDIVLLAAEGQLKLRDACRKRDVGNVKG